MNWMDELAEETFARAIKELVAVARNTIKSMRNEFRKDKIRRIFNIGL